MPFISSTPPRFSSNTTKGLYIGKVEAEGENNPGQGLKEYYEDYLNINNALAEGKFIIVGRKGVGKSAYVKHLCDNSSLENEILCDVVKNDNISLHKILQLMPNEIENKACLIYEWIILTEFVKLLLSNENLKYSNGYDALSKFQSINSGLVSLDKWMSVSETTTKSFEVNFYPLKKAFPLNFAKHLEHPQSKAPFYRIIPSLREIVVQMLAYEANIGINFIVLFDDLDVHFNLRSVEQKSELMDLIRVARDYNTKYFPNQNIKVVLMLRDDIAMQLDGIAPDKNKIFSSYEYKLQWYEADKDMSDEYSKLRQFINRRIKIGLNKIGIDAKGKDPWSVLVNNAKSLDYKGKTAFKYILDYTFYRPRDFVAFFKDIGDYSYKLPLNSDCIKSLVTRYVNWNAQEIKDELTNLYSKEQINDLFKLLKKVADMSGGVRYEDIINMMNECNLTIEDFENLVYYNYLIPNNGDIQYFSYREADRVGNWEDYTYSLPKGLYHYFKQRL